MKRLVVCSDCRAKLRETFPTDFPHEGEYIKFRDGKLHQSGCKCDQCDRALVQDEPASCVSMWADYGGIPYFPWEFEFITTEKPA